MRGVGRRFAGDRRGATILEFGIVAPVMIAMLIGVFNVGYAIYCGAAVRNAIQRSSRVLILTPSTSAATITTHAKSLLIDVPVNNLNVALTTETVNANMQIQRISWTYDYVLWVPFARNSTMNFASSLVVPMVPTN
ncbi:MAG TPA: TadE/TadG family type IV pilus assembly protein [Asticcacaulis sp.]|nr:TadE/TadG family type IV pilus assembly protein [Asticcacaulis sp.]